MKVPFLDLHQQTESLWKELNTAVKRVIKSCNFVGGPFIEAFEHDFADFCGRRYAIGVGSGTEALGLTLQALGIGQDDEVITVPNTFIATAEAISYSGAKPVFVDTDPVSYNIAVENIGEAISPRTKAIIPVHLYGQMADMDPIMEIAGAYRLHVIEDACQAHGATYKDKPAGSIGIAGCFSFYPGKNLGAFGDAGAVVTDNPDLNFKLRALRDHGQVKRYQHDTLGWNARLDGIQAAILQEKLKHLQTWNENRRTVARWYGQELQGIVGLQLPYEVEHIKHVFHLYAIQIHYRDELINYLAKHGISCGIHYPVPIHLQKAYGHLGYSYGDFPESESACRRTISLPMFPEITRDQVKYVAAAIRDFTISYYDKKD